MTCALKIDNCDPWNQGYSVVIDKNADDGLAYNCEASNNNNECAEAVCY